MHQWWIFGLKFPPPLSFVVPLFKAGRVNVMATWALKKGGINS